MLVLAKSALGGVEFVVLFLPFLANNNSSSSEATFLTSAAFSDSTASRREIS